jgi:hypothetical protein
LVTLIFAMEIGPFWKRVSGGMSLGSCRRYSTRKRRLEGEWAGSASRFQAARKRRSSVVRALPIGIAAGPAAAAPDRGFPDHGDNPKQSGCAPVTVRVA